MSLPINIDKLIHGKTVEWERLEFKESWNPEEVLHTVCAFANDFNNWNGGYIIIGIAEENKRPVLPPKGITQAQADSFQQKLRELSRKLDPHYFPITEPVVYQNELVLIIWVPPGDQRPYTAPISISERKSERAHYIRENSSTVVAKGKKLTELFQLSNKIPFDKRINHDAEINDLDFGLIRTHLQKINSKLFDESASMRLVELSKKMMIVGGPSEHLRPLNVGLMLFSNDPEKWFENARIEVIIHDSNKRREFVEKTFKGPIHIQLQEAHNFIKNEIIRQKIIKSPERAISKKVWNFPFDAVEEALSNAVYHKDYSMGRSVEVQIWPNKKIIIINYPGPLPPIGEKELEERKIFAREYRNPKLGDFLKELNLTEARATGITTIDDSMRENGSPEAIIRTDKERIHFYVELIAHEAFKNEAVYQLIEVDDFITWDDVMSYIEGVASSFAIVAQDSNQDSNQDVSAQVSAQVGDEVRAKIENMLKNKVASIESTKTVVATIAKEAMSRGEILTALGLTNQRKNYLKHIEPLIRLGFVKFTIPSKPTSKNQKYMLTIKGIVLKEIISIKQ